MLEVDAGEEQVMLTLVTLWGGYNGNSSSWAYIWVTIVDRIDYSNDTATASPEDH